MTKRTLDSKDYITYAKTTLYKGTKCHPHQWSRTPENYWVKSSCTYFTCVKKKKSSEKQELKVLF